MSPGDTGSCSAGENPGGALEKAGVMRGCRGAHPVPPGNGCRRHNAGPAKGPEADPRIFTHCCPRPRWCGINNKYVVRGMQFFLSFPWNRAASELCYHLLQGPMVYSLPFSSRLQKPSNRPATPHSSPACWEPGFQAWAQSTCPELSAQGLVPLRWGCALPSPNAPGKAPSVGQTASASSEASGKVGFVASSGYPPPLHLP